MGQEALWAQLKKDVRSLLISSKMGLDADHLRRDYMNMLGHPIPLKALGFCNIMDMVKDMPDVVNVHHTQNGPIFRAISDECTKNIEQLVAKQKVSKSDMRKKDSFNRSTPSHYRCWPPPVVPPRWSRSTPFLPAELRVQLRILLSQGPIRVIDLENCFLRCFARPLRVHSYGFYSTIEMLQAAADMVTVLPSSVGALLMLREHMMPNKRNVPSVPIRSSHIKSQPPGYPAPSSQATVSATEATQGPPSSNQVAKQEAPGWQNAQRTDGIACKPDPVVKNQEAQVDQPYKERIIQLEDKLYQSILENGVAGTISPELKEKLRKTVSQSSGGMSIHDVPEEYKKQFGEELPLRQNGFVSVTELLGAMSDTFLLRSSRGKDGCQLVVTDVKESHTARSGSDKIGVKCTGDPQTKEQTDDSANNNRNQEMGLRRNVVHKVQTVHCHSTVPEDAMQCERLKPPAHGSPRELKVVLVEHVVSPGQFYIRFSECKEARALEDMMMDMRRCYTSADVAKRYRLPKSFIRQGQVCCVTVKGMWFYRVVIHKVISPAQVEVYYADYGLLSVVQSSNLMFLKSCYSILPAQAVPSSLAGIKSSNGSWSTEATDAFMDLCSDHNLVGALDRYVGDVLLLYLCDTSTAIDVYIHEELLQRGYGTACSTASSAEMCVQFSTILTCFGEELPQPRMEVEEDVSFSNQAVTHNHSPSAALETARPPSPSSPTSADSTSSSPSMVDHTTPPRVPSPSLGLPDLEPIQPYFRGVLTAPLHRPGISFPLFGARKLFGVNPR